MRLLYLGPIAWNSIRQRPHHLASRLLREFPGAYLGPVGLRSARPGDLRRLFPGANPAGQEASQIAVANLRYVPLLGIPGIDAFNRDWLWRQARRVFPFDDGPWTLWASTPSLLARTLLERGRPRLVVYDCMDRYAAFHSGRTARRIDAAEARLVERADLVFASSRTLCERLDRIKPGAIYLPNGVDAEAFGVERPAAMPAALAGLPRPIVGFHGTLGDWVDYSLINKLARARPQWSFVLAGPAHSAGVRDIERLPNVRLTGAIPYDALPQFSACFDVGILPFATNELTRHVFPIKVLEYLALGLPCVCTPLPELASFGKCVSLAETPDAWLPAIEAALGPPSREAAQIAARRQFAQKYDWNRIAGAALDRLNAAWRRGDWRPTPGEHPALPQFERAA
jgi:glycosyltransferase involved in cell wall biosynthesis